MNIQELKKNSSEQLISQAEELGVENASTLRKQEILFAILKKLFPYSANPLRKTSVSPSVENVYPFNFKFDLIFL